MAVPPMAMMLAGGTGGHVYPALAVALELRERGFELQWIGTNRGLEARVLGEHSIPLQILPMRGLRGKGLLQQVQALVLLLISLLQSLWLMLRFRPAVVVGMGGYVSFPAALAAWMLRRPLMLQEQNAIAGSANRALARFASRIATGFPNVLSGHPQALYLGNPVRAALRRVGENQSWHWDATRPLQILVLGGSLGAQSLNEAIPAVAQTFGIRCRWRHQCGEAHLADTQRIYAGMDSLDVDLSAFIDDMEAAYAWADLVICRAGALTVAELAVTGRPSILVPLPGAIDDHQTVNARFLSDASAALLLSQAELPRLAHHLSTLLDSPELLANMASAARTCARPDATAAIADIAEQLAGGRTA